MRNKSLFWLFFLIFLVSFSFFAKPALADGVVIRSDPQKWDYADETNQQAFIKFENGLEKMIISVDFNKENNNLVWLFPVPSNPDRVSIDVVKTFPLLMGEEISTKARKKTKEIKKYLQMTQLYTIPVLSLFDKKTTPLKNDSMPQGFLEASESSDKDFDLDVLVYEHLEKEGITSEIITAKTAAGLYDYLKNQGLKIEEGSIAVLNNYIGKEYSFIVSWINPQTKTVSAEEIKKNLSSYFLRRSRYPKFFNLVDSLKPKYPDYNKTYPVDYLTSSSGEQFFQELVQAIQTDPSIVELVTDKGTEATEQRGVFVSFFTDKIFFPLLPTSVYGSKIVPATIRIFGYTSPKIFNDIKNYTQTEYFLDSSAHFTDKLKDFYFNDDLDKKIKYTKIEIKAPSKFLTDDLWINNNPPLKISYTFLLAEQPVIMTIILATISSVIASLLAGLLIFKDLRKNPVKLFLLGLSNCLSIMGLILATLLVGTKNKDEKARLLLAEIKHNGYFWKRKLSLILFFVFIPLLVICLPVSLGTIKKVISRPEKYFLISDYGFSYLRDFLISVFISGVLPLVAILIGFRLKKIKTEDRDLFRQLRTINYSSWSFQSKDKLKILFIPFFSGLFLIVSWLLVEIVKTTL